MLKIQLHRVKGNISSVTGLDYWIKYPYRPTGLSLIIGKRELAIGDCMTDKRMAEEMCELEEFPDDKTKTFLD